MVSYVAILFALCVGCAVAHPDPMQPEVRKAFVNHRPSFTELHRRVVKHDVMYDLKQCSTQMMRTLNCATQNATTCHNSLVYRWDEGGYSGMEKRSIYMRCTWYNLKCDGSQLIAMATDNDAICWDKVYVAPSVTPTPSATMSITPSMSYIPTQLEVCLAAKRVGSNQAPMMLSDVFMPERILIQKGEPVNFALDKYFCDPDDDTLTYHADNLPVGLAIGKSDTAANAIVGVADYPGHYSIEVHASDGHPHEGETHTAVASIWVDVVH